MFLSCHISITFWSLLIHFGPLCSTSVHLVYFGLLWSNSVHFCQLSFILVQFGLVQSIQTSSAYLLSFRTPLQPFQSTSMKVETFCIQILDSSSTQQQNRLTFPLSTLNPTHWQFSPSPIAFLFVLSLPLPKITTHLLNSSMNHPHVSLSSQQYLVQKLFNFQREQNYLK